MKLSTVPQPDTPPEIPLTRYSGNGLSGSANSLPHGDLSMPTVDISWMPSDPKPENEDQKLPNSAQESELGNQNQAHPDDDLEITHKSESKPETFEQPIDNSNIKPNLQSIVVPGDNFESNSGFNGESNENTDFGDRWNPTVHGEYNETYLRWIIRTI